jgi:heterotetrameric sarcosine oxidase gamma subunit
MSTSGLDLEALEFKAFEFPLTSAAAAALPASPGAVERGTGIDAGTGIDNGSSTGRAVLLHFAPGRFLAPAPTPDTEQRLLALQAAGVGAMFDVEGKWQAFALTAPGAERALSSTIDLAQALGARDCAALHLFDCPAVLSRRGEGFEVWVEASYAVAFREMLGELIGGTE